jgi:rhodanese-related sulfurtransferase
MVILAIGVRPENGLAKAAGLELGERGGIRVDEQMRTSDPRIWAVGDAVEVRDAITGQWALVPLAGPANRQGRAAADAICGQKTSFRGVQGSAICEVFGLAAAMTGASEKALKRAGISDFEKIYLHPQQHAGYYPGARRIHLKVLYRKSDGLILGAQAIGEEGVDKRIDVISMAIQKGGSVFDLEEAELCYAPQFGSAKDPLNMAGMIAANSLRDNVRNATWESIDEKGFTLLDVRDPDEFENGHVDRATNIPLADLRQRLHELPRSRAIRVYCGVGQRAYNAARMLRQKGFRVENLSGGYETYLNFRRARMLHEKA